MLKFSFLISSKNKFTKRIMECLSQKYEKEFIWKFSATSHGNGVVDGVGGNVKSTVRRKTMSKSSERIVLQDAASFATAAKQLVRGTVIIYITKEEVEAYEKEKPFEGCSYVPGISKMHVISVKEDVTKLWRYVY